ncbi:MAG: mechanosensitive ion channel family protein [Lachnospiraceae bacterium]|nr:mechanosensitive ion channel family protein [Lachnospiraceae bacterium]
MRQFDISLTETLQSLADLKIGDFSVASILQAVITFVICYIVARVILSLLKKALDRTALDRKLVSVIHTAVKIVLYVLIALIIIDSVGIPITSLVAVFSVVGLAFSLAIQSFLTNCAGGLQLLVAKPFAVGDFIETGAVLGTVRSIGFIYTKVETIDNKIVHIPNSDISASKITNYTTEPLRRVDMIVTASYEDDAEKVKKAIYTAIGNLPVFLQDPAPFVAINAFKESRIEYVVRAWLKTADYWDGYFGLMDSVYREFKKQDINMAYDHMDVKIVQ